MTEIRKLQIPRHDGQTETIETTGNFVIVGANGSGKTRLGAYIESNYCIEVNGDSMRHVHRVSALRPTAMPSKVTTIMSVKEARKELLHTYHQEAHLSLRQAYFQDKNLAITPSDDYAELMTYLFSKQTEQLANFYADCQKSGTKIDPPEAILTQLRKVWEKLLPHRELVVGPSGIQTQIRGEPNTSYASTDMRDGERIIFYLIGQCLAVDDNGIIIIDEPELHIHKSLVMPLWTEIEKLRSDCLFVYITHDIDFAIAQKNAKCIWLKSYKKATDTNPWTVETWDLGVISDEQTKDIPSELLVEILGSRKPVLIVEGISTSTDAELYGALLSCYSVTPHAGCTEVIKKVKGMRTAENLHRLNVYGLIDRDRRVTTEINNLRTFNIFTLEVAEIENLLCAQEVLALVSESLNHDPSADFQNVRDQVFSWIKDQLEIQVSEWTIVEVKHRAEQELRKLDGQLKVKDTRNGALVKVANSVDIEAIYKKLEREFQDVIDTNDYAELLRLCKDKELRGKVETALSLASGGLKKEVLRLTQTDKKNAVIEAIRPYLGGFPIDGPPSESDMTFP